MDKFPQGRPRNYDRSFDFLNEKGMSHEMPKLGLDAIKDFGSPVAEQNKTTHKILGGDTRRIPGINGTSAKQTRIPDDPMSIPLPLGKKPGDFEDKQIPNTGPKFKSADDIRVNPSTRKITHSAKLMISHGKDASKKGIS